MANRRMIAKRITSNSAFLRMHAQAQALYLHLSAECDDDGVADATIIRRMAGFRANALEELISNGFVIEEQQGSGIVWLVDWQGYNTYKADRTTESIHRNNIAVTICNSNNPLISKKSLDFWKQFVSEGKDIVDEEIEGNTRSVEVKPATTAPSALEVDSFYQAYCLNKGYIPRDNFTERFLTYHHGKDWEKDVRSWADQDAKSDRLKAQHTQKRQHNSIQNFTPSDADWDDLANQIREKEEREMLNHS